MVQKMEIKQKRANLLARAPVWALWGKQATQGRWGWSYQPGQQQRAQSFKSIQASVNYWGLQVRHHLSLASAGLIAPSHHTQLFLTRPSNISKLPPLGLCTFIFHLEQSSTDILAPLRPVLQGGSGRECALFPTCPSFTLPLLCGWCFPKMPQRSLPSSVLSPTLWI